MGKIELSKEDKLQIMRMATDFHVAGWGGENVIETFEKMVAAIESEQMKIMEMAIEVSKYEEGDYLYHYNQMVAALNPDKKEE